MIGLLQVAQGRYSDPEDAEICQLPLLLAALLGQVYSFPRGAQGRSLPVTPLRECRAALPTGIGPKLLLTALTGCDMLGWVPKRRH